MQEDVTLGDSLGRGYAISDAVDIRLKNAIVTSNDLLNAVVAVNTTLVKADERVGQTNLHLFDIMDLRMLSGLIGELFVAELCALHTDFLCKNQSIDGYPDICDVSLPGWRGKVSALPSSAFINFEHGGIEVKNTFGVKKAKAYIGQRDSRISRVQSVLVWKAHHRETNHLIALQSDFIEGIPQIIAVFFSNELTQNDWTVKQQPKTGSTMTSFCQTAKTGFQKLRAGLRIYRLDIGLERFLGISGTAEVQP